MNRNRFVAATLLSLALPALALTAPAKMRAIVQSGGTGPESLKLQTIDTPAPYAAGGAGSVAVVVAKDRGAKVVASGHSSQQAYLQTLGVDEFVAYDKENVAAKIGTVDAVLNMVDGQADAGLGYVKNGGYFTSIAGGPGEDKCKAASVTCVVIGPGYRGPSLGETLKSLAQLADRPRSGRR